MVYLNSLVKSKNKNVVSQHILVESGKAWVFFNIGH